MRICLQIRPVSRRRAVCLVDDRLREAAGADVMEVIGPVPLLAGTILLPRRLESRPEVVSRVHDQSLQTARHQRRKDAERLEQLVGDPTAEHVQLALHIPGQFSDQFPHALERAKRLHEKVLEVLDVTPVIGHQVENVRSDGPEASAAHLDRVRVIGRSLLKIRARISQEGLILRVGGEPLHDRDVRTRCRHQLFLLSAPVAV